MAQDLNGPGAKFHETWRGGLIITICWFVAGAFVVAQIEPRADPFVLGTVRVVFLCALAAYWSWFVVRLLRSTQRRREATAFLAAFLSSFLGNILALAVYVLAVGVTGLLFGAPFAAFLFVIIIPIVYARMKGKGGSGDQNHGGASP